MNGWSLSGSQKANHHWQSGNKGDIYPLRPWEWAQGYILGQLLYKYRFTNYTTFNYLSGGIKNPFDITAESNTKPYKSFTYENIGDYYFKITISVKSRPTYLRGIPLYYTGIQMGKAISSSNARRGFISSTDIASEVYYSREFEKINAQVNAEQVTRSFTFSNQSDFIPADSIINQNDGILLDRPLTIYVKIPTTYANGVIYLYPKVWIDYKYTDTITIAGIPADGTIAYYGYGLSNADRLLELMRKIQVNATDKYTQLTSDEKSELMKLTNLGIGLKISQIEETEFNTNAQKYGTTN